MCDKLPYNNPRIDKCIQGLVDGINSRKNKKTLASCCGHGKYPTTIIVKDIPSGHIYEWFSGISLGSRKRNRYYKTDKEKYYYIPEVVENWKIES